jgi:hypothetical protein
MEGARFPFVIDPSPIENAIRRIAVFLNLDEEIAATDACFARDEKAVATLDPRGTISATPPLSIACSNCAGCTRPLRRKSPHHRQRRRNTELAFAPNDGAICALGWFW